MHELLLLESTSKSDKLQRCKKSHVTKEKGNEYGSKYPSKTRKSVKTFVINWQNVVNKKEALMTMINSAVPDIIIGTETWLNPTNKIFPPDI